MPASAEPRTAPGSAPAFLRNLESGPPWFQLGNLGVRQLVFDTMWSAGDALGFEIAIQFALLAAGPIALAAVRLGG